MSSLENAAFVKTSNLYESASQVFTYPAMESVWVFVAVKSLYLFL
jgi:hypothetical protein